MRSSFFKVLLLIVCLQGNSYGEKEERMTAMRYIHALLYQPTGTR